VANPTSNFGWQMPTPVDLVTDLPADFEVFGQAVDTSLADLKGGTTGQILAKNSNTDMDFVWSSPNPGDITAVTAGTGISGGGTSGDVTITNSMATAIDAKGDLIAGTGADAFSRLAVGTNGTALVADSTASTGLKWGAPTSLGCSLWKSANQSTSNVTQTPINFNNEDFDTSGFHDNVTNNDRVTIPTGLGGKYLVTTKIDFAANATGQRVLYHFINGVLVNLALSPVNSSVNGSSFELSGVYNLSAGNFIQMQVYQDSGGSLNVLGAAQYYTNMQVMYLGA
jgi:hypothetical protein